ncbi:hypothetical protein GCM10010840_06190 [Deinococcus aerolatus]|uniref:Uncharacterized protein n=1 Tax=Deinococcus aerolatus TaxID=522487 RepID=A0ABQ2G1Q5_9DEIO|nr:hypothetical protein [Deinococcus aerolatus]GGL70806.1 hypothetical protein GCM10010840_06190 [Deinococcus aerolatus]
MDEIVIQPAIHNAVGGIVVLAAIVTVMLNWRGLLKLRGVGADAAAPPSLSGWQNAALIALQIALMVQALIGIKLLDQGLGTVQKYVHYLGGLGALGLVMLYYWLPKRDARDSSIKALGLTVASLAFVLMTFIIGGLYARGSLS